MKKITLVAIIILVSLNINAQKVKVKDGKVLIDKVPVAIIEGKAGAFHYADLKYKSLDGELLFTLIRPEITYFIPDSIAPAYYDIVFSNPSKRVKYLFDGAMYSDDAISKIMFVQIDPPLLIDNKIDPASLKEFIANYDATEKLSKDSIRYYNFENSLIEKLKSSKTERLKDKPINCQVIKTGPRFSHAINQQTNVTIYEIKQDNVLIGRIECDVTVPSQATIPQTVYTIYKKLKTPLVINDKNIDMGFAAFYEDSSFPSIKTMENKSVVKIKFESVQKLAEYMVKNGYL